jgi:hypothetical protein
MKKIVDINADLVRLLVNLNKIHHSNTNKINVIIVALRKSTRFTIRMFLKNTESNGIIVKIIG